MRARGGGHSSSLEEKETGPTRPPPGPLPGPPQQLYPAMPPPYLPGRPMGAPVAAAARPKPSKPKDAEEEEAARKKHTIGGSADLKIVRAETDKKLVAMVPAALRTKRQGHAEAKLKAKKSNPFFGLHTARNEKPAPAPAAAPESAPAAKEEDEDPMAAFMSEMGELGAV